MTRSERAAAPRLGGDSGDGAAPATAAAFRHEMEDRIQCAESQRVSYKRMTGLVWPLHIPVEAATNKEALQDYQVRLLQPQRCRFEVPLNAIPRGIR